MADAKLNVTIAGQCLMFAGWKFIDCGVYQKGLKHIQIWGQVDSPSLRIQECDENADELGELYYAQTIAEFRDVVRLISVDKFTIVEASEFLISEGWIVQQDGQVFRKGSHYIQIGNGPGLAVRLQSFDIVGGGHGKFFYSSSLLEFKGYFYDFQVRFTNPALQGTGIA